MHTYPPPNFLENSSVLHSVPLHVQARPWCIRRFFPLPARRIDVCERVRLNYSNQANGQLEHFFNGVWECLGPFGCRPERFQTDLVLQTGAAGRVRGLQMQTFLEFSVAIIDTFRSSHRMYAILCSYHVVLDYCITILLIRDLYHGRLVSECKGSYIICSCSEL
ncbi:hypothetical protein BJV78DRAFT_756323 [Lactifluus subvellereus]|nr:hypothetical protein BJV78DRAFT_756323 [Lactifluus subvellereus]